MNDRKEIFFQSSLPRSGSTILQNIVGQNPQFYTTPTSGVLELLFAARGNYTSSPEFKAQDSKTMRDGWLGFCEQGLQGFYQAITDKPLILDKSRGWGIHYGFLNTFIENPKIVVMVRDLRSIYASMEKNYRKNPESEQGVLSWSKMSGTTTAKRVDSWAQGPPVGMAIERLQSMIHENIIDKVLVIRYEDLLQNPNQELDRLYKYLGKEPFKHDFNNIQQLTHEDDSVYGGFGDHIIRPKLEYFDPKFEEVLGKSTCDNIVNTYRWFYDYFNYKH
jgi:sulfotransferase